MPDTAENVLNRERIETVVQKLLIWELPRRTYSMSERNTVLKSGDDCRAIVFL